MKKESTTEKAPVLQKKVLYSVNPGSPDDVLDDYIYVYDSLEEAYKYYIQNEGDSGGKLHAYKIEYMGEVKMELIIK